MNANLRACVAHLVGRLSGQPVSPAVYDHSQKKSISVSGSVSMGNVALYDHSRNAHLTGTVSNLYDHGEQSHLSLTVKDTTFEGHDHKSGCHFSGSINGQSVVIYDHESSQHHQYNI